ncbi:ATP-grasp domain-containing protein [Lactiplantibacillus paraplantarum]|uniref:ATP-grasp domain-containing protein n=1 Tax=Lactiplantibacillus paraplantarum TaxID=60520 RepID=A0A4Q9XZK2_9LACO|nr:ATP-grasp domain-containing protein [Lactiplantibacillus paraplantarum]
MKKRVILVEPSFYGVSFVQAARELGCEVICVVSNKNNPEKFGYENKYDDLLIADIRDSDSVLKAIQNSNYQQFDAIIPATDYVTAVTAKVAEKLGMFGNSYFATKCARNKDLARLQYAQKGVPSAKFAVVKTIDEALKASKRIGFPLILKPTNTASSIDVFYVQNEQQLRSRFVQISQLKQSYMHFKVRQEYILEEFMSGPEFSVELFLSNDEIAFVEVTEKHTTKPPYFVELMHVFPTTVGVEYKKEIINTAYSAVRALGFHNGPTHVEVKLTDTGARVVEVNGRPGGDNITSDLIKDAYGIDIFKETVKLYLNKTVTIKPTRHDAAAISFLFSNCEGRFEAVQGLDCIEATQGFQRLKIEVSSGDNVVSPTSSDDRIGYYILSGPNANKLKEIIDSLSTKVNVIVNSDSLM